MADKLNRLTDQASKALHAAQDAARNLNHNAVGPEHLLVALALDEQCTAMKALRELGVEPGQILRTVHRAVALGERQLFGKPTLTEQAKRVVEFAVDEARQVEDRRIGTEHLLLGLLRQEENKAMEVLQALGVTPDALRGQTLYMIRKRQAQDKRGNGTVGIGDAPDRPVS